MAKKGKKKKRRRSTKTTTRKKKSWKRQLSLTLQTVAALEPEIAATVESVERGDFSKWHVRWIRNRTGYDLYNKTWDWKLPVIHNAISIGVPIIIRAAMRGVK